MPLELLSLPLPLLLIALATVLVLLLLSLVLSLEAVLDDIRICLRQREVLRNGRQGLLRHWLDLYYVRYGDGIAYLIEETGLDLVATNLFSVPDPVLELVQTALTLHLTIALADPLNNIIAGRGRSVRDDIAPHLSWCGMQGTHPHLMAVLELRRQTPLPGFSA